MAKEEKDLEDIVFKNTDVSISDARSICPMFRRKNLVGLGADDFAEYDAERVVNYPPSVTDQTHAMSLADQVKVGEAQIRDDDNSVYDFKPGEKDDGREAVGVYDYSEPAERFEAEQSVHASIEKEVQTQIAKRRDEEKQKSTNNSTSASEPQNSTSEPSEKDSATN